LGNQKDASGKEGEKRGEIVIQVKGEEQTKNARKNSYERLGPGALGKFGKKQGSTGNVTLRMEE